MFFSFYKPRHRASSRLPARAPQPAPMPAPPRPRVDNEDLVLLDELLQTAARPQPRRRWRR